MEKNYKYLYLKYKKKYFSKKEEIQDFNKKLEKKEISDVFKDVQKEFYTEIDEVTMKKFKEIILDSKIISPTFSGKNLELVKKFEEEIKRNHFQKKNEYIKNGSLSVFLLKFINTKLIENNFEGFNKIFEVLKRIINNNIEITNFEMINLIEKNLPEWIKNQKVKEFLEEIKLEQLGGANSFNIMGRSMVNFGIRLLLWILFIYNVQYGEIFHSLAAIIIVAIFTDFFLYNNISTQLIDDATTIINPIRINFYRNWTLISIVLLVRVYNNIFR